MPPHRADGTGSAAKPAGYERRAGSAQHEGPRLRTCGSCPTAAASSSMAAAVSPSSSRPAVPPTASKPQQSQADFVWRRGGARQGTAGLLAQPGGLAAATPSQTLLVPQHTPGPCCIPATAPPQPFHANQPSSPPPSRSKHSSLPARPPHTSPYWPARAAKRTPRRMRAGSARNDSPGGQMVRSRRARQSAKPPTASNSRRLR